MSTSEFNDPWDSGQVGFAFMTADEIRECFLIEGELTDGHFLKAKDLIVSEVGTYDAYLRGEVYGYIATNPKSSDEDSCWGFYDLKDVKGEAEAAAEGLAEQHLATWKDYVSH
jgi:hypothetical protein